MHSIHPDEKSSTQSRSHESFYYSASRSLRWVKSTLPNVAHSLRLAPGNANTANQLLPEVVAHCLGDAPLS